MSPEQLYEFMRWLLLKQKQHEELGGDESRTEAFRLNHQSRALGFLEVLAEIKIRYKEL